MTTERGRRVLDTGTDLYGSRRGGEGIYRGTVWPFGLLLLLAGLLLAASAFYIPGVVWLQQSTVALSTASQICPRRLLLALMLLTLSYGVMRRRQVAFYVTLLLAALGTVTLQSTGWTLIFAVFSLGLALSRNAFTVPPQPERLRAALKFGLMVLVVGYVYIQLGHHFSLTSVRMSTLLLLVSCVIVALSLRAAPAPLPADAVERARVARLLQSPDADTLAPFALRHDKSYVFSEDGRAAIGYRVLLGVAVAGGDPVGHSGSFQSAIDAFIALCQNKGWEPAAVGARADLAPMWRRYKLNVIGIGDEVVLDVDSFTLVGRRMLNVRQTVAHTRKLGVTSEIWREGDLSPALREELADLSKRWLHGHQERGFSMILDGLLAGFHPDCLLVVTRDKDGRPVGFQRYAYCRDGKALSLDTMRRDRRGPGGLNERMIVEVTEFARARGVKEISLNFAAFRPLLDAGEQRSGVQQLAYRALHLLDPFIQVESLYRFNAKFHPGFVERSVVLPSWSVFPMALAALLGMEFAFPYDRNRYRRAQLVSEVTTHEVALESSKSVS